MKTSQEVDDTATLFGWECRNRGTYIRGDYCVMVDYSTSGHVTRAALYRFYKLDQLQLQERAVGKNKRADVMAWLAA